MTAPNVEPPSSQPPSAARFSDVEYRTADGPAVTRMGTCLLAADDIDAPGYWTGLMEAGQGRELLAVLERGVLRWSNECRDIEALRGDRKDSAFHPNGIIRMACTEAGQRYIGIMVGLDKPHLEDQLLAFLRRNVIGDYVVEVCVAVAVGIDGTVGYQRKHVHISNT